MTSRETLFTVAPTLGTVAALDITFQDGTIFHLEGEVLKQWMMDHMAVVAMVLSLQTATGKHPPKQFEGLNKLYGDS